MATVNIFHLTIKVTYVEREFTRELNLSILYTRANKNYLQIT